jgi:hypothetical protein
VTVNPSRTAVFAFLDPREKCAALAGLADLRATPPTSTRATVVRPRGRPGIVGGGPVGGCPAAPHGRAGPGPTGWRRATRVVGTNRDRRSSTVRQGNPRTPVGHHEPPSTFTQLRRCASAIRAGSAHPLIRSGSTSEESRSPASSNARIALDMVALLASRAAQSGGGPTPTMAGAVPSRPSDP